MSKPPLLFVHGAWHGAWCWEEHFTAYFERLGYQVRTFDLRGHRRGAGPARLPWHRVRDYVQDVQAEVAKLDRPPVLIGHSMGGFVVQKYLEKQAGVAGAVLVASVPPRGVFSVTMERLRSRPGDLFRTIARSDLYQLVKGPERARELFYSPAIDEESVRQYSEAIGNESYRAFLDMLILALPRPSKIRGKVPMLVLGGAEDRIFPPDAVRATAAAYGTSAQIFDSMAHNLMLEVGWERVAGAIGDWLDQEVSDTPA